jgi:hypothetical protein
MIAAVDIQNDVLLLKLVHLPLLRHHLVCLGDRLAEIGGKSYFLFVDKQRFPSVKQDIG